MLRQLLTLLAVLSGFTLAAEPVSASQAGVVSVAAARDAEECKAVVNAPVALLRQHARLDRTRESGCKRRPVLVWAPTVMLQADRARE